jgi:hypothetical protein
MPRGLSTEKHDVPHCPCSTPAEIFGALDTATARRARIGDRVRNVVTNLANLDGIGLCSGTDSHWPIAVLAPRGT